MLKFLRSLVFLAVCALALVAPAGLVLGVSWIYPGLADDLQNWVEGL